MIIYASPCSASARLLRKADQTRAFLSVCHVMWSGKVKDDNGKVQVLHDEKKVEDFLKKVIQPDNKLIGNNL